MTSKCVLEKRPQDILAFNSYILRNREMKRKTVGVQRFIRRVVGRRYVRLAKAAQHSSARKIQRLFRGHKDRVKAHDMRVQLRLYIKNGKHLQKEMNSLMAIHFARQKLQFLIGQDHAARLLQRVFRGHMARKQTRPKLNRRSYFDKCIVVLAWKLMLLTAARKVHALIVRVQRIIRSYLIRKRLTELVQHVGTLRRVVRTFARRVRVKISRRVREEKMRIKKNASAKRIQRFWRNRRHNRSIINFVTDCAEAYSDKFEQTKWRVTRIQAQFRRYRVQKNYFRYLSKRYLQLSSCTFIQAVWRRYYSNKNRFFQHRKRLKRIATNFRALCYGQLHAYYSAAARVIQ